MNVLNPPVSLRLTPPLRIGATTPSPPDKGGKGGLRWFFSYEEVDMRFLKISSSLTKGGKDGRFYIIFNHIIL